MVSKRISPRQLAYILPVTVIAPMVGLGLFIIGEYRELQLNSLGKIGSVYVDTLLASYALAPDGQRASATIVRQAIEDVIESRSDEVAHVALRVWAPDGGLVYSNIAGDGPENHDSTDLHLALDGKYVARLETTAGPGEATPIPLPFFEIYVPIHHPQSGELVGVGELYQNAATMLAERAFVERTVWAAIAMATLGILAMMGLSIRQISLLDGRLAEERRMARVNRKLRREANEARLDAAQANEQVLNVVGADLHDGPVQILGLASLMADRGTDAALPDGTTLASLVRNALAQLRKISTGLVLPELEGLGIRSTCELAVNRHRNLTGRHVHLDVDAVDTGIDLPRSACLYRVIQEGLTNASRHSEDDEPQVHVGQDGRLLKVSVSNAIQDVGSEAGDKLTGGLGLQGIRRRLAAFEGSCEFTTDGGQARLSVVLPLSDIEAASGKRIN